MREEKVFIPSNGSQLEGLLSIHEALPVKGGVIFCHPHPQYGGDMHNSVITTAVEAASQEGFSTLRFNFRGVGESTGSYGEGIGERGDVEAVVEYLSLKLKDFDPPLILLGYSFGAWAGLPIGVRDRRIQGMVAIAPPLEMYDFEFLKGCQKRKLFIAGNRDLFCPSSLLEEWYQQLEEPKSLTIISGADHFFFFHTRHLIEPLREFFSGTVRSD
jgi:alpha/beta superfamily hydrolase